MNNSIKLAIGLILLIVLSFNETSNVLYFNEVVKNGKKSKIANSVYLKVNFDSNTFFFYSHYPFGPFFAKGKVQRLAKDTILFQSTFNTFNLKMNISDSVISQNYNVLKFVDINSEYGPWCNFTIIVNDSFKYYCKFPDSVFINKKVTSIQVVDSFNSFIFEKKYVNFKNSRIFCTLDVFSGASRYVNFNNIIGTYDSKKKILSIINMDERFYKKGITDFKETDKEKSKEWIKKTVYGPYFETMDSD